MTPSSNPTHSHHRFSARRASQLRRRLHKTLLKGDHAIGKRHYHQNAVSLLSKKLSSPSRSAILIKKKQPSTSTTRVARPSAPPLKKKKKINSCKTPILNNNNNNHDDVQNGFPSIPNNHKDLLTIPTETVTPQPPSVNKNELSKWINDPNVSKWNRNRASLCSAFFCGMFVVIRKSDSVLMTKRPPPNEALTENQCNVISTMMKTQKDGDAIFAEDPESFLLDHATDLLFDGATQWKPRKASKSFKHPDYPSPKYFYFHLKQSEREETLNKPLSKRDQRLYDNSNIWSIRDARHVAQPFVPIEKLKTWIFTGEILERIEVPDPVTLLESPDDYIIISRSQLLETPSEWEKTFSSTEAQWSNAYQDLDLQAILSKCDIPFSSSEQDLKDLPSHALLWTNYLYNIPNGHRITHSQERGTMVIKDNTRFLSLIASCMAHQVFYRPVSVFAPKSSFAFLADSHVRSSYWDRFTLLLNGDDVVDTTDDSSPLSSPLPCNGNDPEEVEEITDDCEMVDSPPPDDDVAEKIRDGDDATSTKQLLQEDGTAVVVVDESQYDIIGIQKALQDIFTADVPPSPETSQEKESDTLVDSPSTPSSSSTSSEDDQAMKDDHSVVDQTINCPQVRNILAYLGNDEDDKNDFQLSLSTTRKKHSQNSHVRRLYHSDSLNDMMVIDSSGSSCMNNTCTDGGEYDISHQSELFDQWMEEYQATNPLEEDDLKLFISPSKIFGAKSCDHILSFSHHQVSSPPQVPTTNTSGSLSPLSSTQQHQLPSKEYISDPYAVLSEEFTNKYHQQKQQDQTTTQYTTEVLDSGAV